MKIFHKLVLGFFSVSLFVGIVGNIALNANKRVSNHFEEEAHRRHIEATSAEIASFAKRAESHLILFLTLHDEADREKFFKRHESLLKQIHILGELELYPDIKAVFENIKPEADKILSYGKVLLEAYEKDIASKGAFNIEENEEMVRMFHGAASAVRKGGVELAKLSVDMEYKENIELTDKAETEQRYMFAVTFIAVMLSMTIGYSISRSIRASFRNLAETMADVGRGNLDAVAIVEKKDEIGLMAASFNQMTKELKNITVSRDELSKEMEERIKVERALFEAKKEAEIASIAKSEFLASMSHEIRTPMNVMLGMADVLTETELSPEQRKYLNIINRSGETLLHLINDILDLSKVEAGHLELEHEELSPENLLVGIESFMGVAARKKGIELSYHIEPGVPVKLVGDPKRINQVLFNLASNAIKFTEKGRIDINLRKLGTKDDTAELEFYVRDTGMGIPEDKLDIIFERFTQADASTTRDFGGTGLGITISKLLVENMGGRIWVESELGKGSTFYFTMKLKIAETTEDRETIKKDDGEKFITWKQPLRILLVEDSEDNRMLMHMYLGKTPHIVDIAENGKVAVEKFREGDYDLVLMDVEMPVMDGYTATKEIRNWEHKEKRKSTPVIALTAHALKGHEKNSFDAGCTAHVTKPIKKQMLLETIYEYTKDSVEV